ncbi:MAG: transposase [Hymenobacter sp.]
MEDIASLPARKRYSSDLSIREWCLLEPLLRVRRRSKWPLVEVVNAVLYVLKNGCLWRDLPGDFPPWGTVYWYFSKWQEEGVLGELNACLNVACRENAPQKRSPRA